MPCEVEFTDEFGQWWHGLTEDEQDSVRVGITLLEEYGVALTRPHADTIRESKYPNMRELRIQHRGRPYRILYVFDPRRKAILLIGGDKTGDGRWYVKMLARAEKIYAQLLRELTEEEIQRRDDG